MQTDAVTEQEKLARLLSQEPFAGLKAILDKASAGPAALWESIRAANSYEELLGRMGYKLTLTRQIHLQDCYSRVGPGGGIKAVLPCYDIVTQSSFPTLVNFDGTVTTTPKSVTYFNDLLNQLKRQLVLMRSEKGQV